ncbi:FAD-dependent oxidoreductase [Acidaminococcus sp. NSJ-142]|jgi:ferredoxin-NADP reductase|uniref:ferredoxin--NADP reductase n=1 Tax=Acidaminococcus TaxID=904 RepID=UPI000CF8BEFC|nr:MULTISPECIES: FAD-dependent oxidoreductase [Acidaminococcus]MCD2435261.1 FAD-dependent oxidoreductase [Acidaminococcus hominis]MCH4097140.1 FAD-dependent oxidoreductase [Acidaminococcus provencensis]RHK02050.1 oxidoreductase [Acidaminococcus sp. AM05-11]
MEFTKTVLTKIVQETSDTYSFIMDVPAGFTWKAGQHVAWQIPGFQLDPEDRNTRVFTIASAPEDGYLMFTTRIAEPHTSLKEVLLHQIKPGAEIGVAKPMGKFALDTEHYKETLILAGGIGVTPIRSLLRHYMEQPVNGHKITLLYSDDRGEFAYGDFWKELEKRVPGLDLKLISVRDEFTDGTDAYAKAQGNAAEYLVAGSPGMNKAFTERLEKLGVAAENIKTDVFMGYKD